MREGLREKDGWIESGVSEREMELERGRQTDIQREGRREREKEREKRREKWKQLVLAKNVICY